MRNPSVLRYVECDLPDEVEKAIAAFEDDFEDRIKPFYDRLKDFEENDLPLIDAELDDQINLREQLVNGAPVQSLASLQAIDDTIKLTNPKRDDDDPETVRIDERKLGAAGICLLRGKMYKMLSANKLDAFRYLWESAAGNYDYFVMLGTAVFDLPTETYILYEYNKSKPELLPFVNKGFTKLEALGYYNSQYRHRMLWKQSIGASYALKSKMSDLGYTSDQINNIFSGSQPDETVDMAQARQDTLDGISNLLRSTTRLLFIPPADPLRQPPWENEANYLELAIQAFLEYRARKYTTSSIFDPDYWKLLLSELQPSDIKELLENRPEVKNIELPQDLDNITQIVAKASTVPSETNIINTHMINLPTEEAEETRLTETLFDVGLSIWKRLVLVNPTRAGSLEELLLELSGRAGPLTQLSPYYDSDVYVDPSDVSSLFPTTNLPPVGVLLSIVDGEEVRRAVSSLSLIDSYTTKEGNSETTTQPSGKTQGLASVETFSMLLARRVKWAENFMKCSGEQAVGVNVGEEVAFDQYEDVPYAQVDEANQFSTQSKEAWKAVQEHQANVSYISDRTGMSGSTINNMRTSTNNFLASAEANDKINRKDTRLSGDLATLNSSNDAHKVSSASASLLRKVPQDAPSPSVVPEDYDPTGFWNAANSAAERNDEISRAGGKVAYGDKISKAVAGVQDKLDTTLGQPLPFMGKGFGNAELSATVQICQSGALKELTDWLENNRHKLEDWLIRLINIIRHQIQVFQDKIDAFIQTLQGVMDAILGKLERLLTLDLNFSGKLGFENSLFKCSWGLDFGLKINLLDLLLSYLDRFLGNIMGPFTVGLSILNDFLTEIFCIPLRWIESFLNSAGASTSALLGVVGCTVKDFKLPTELFELMQTIQATFSLRSLVLKKGSADWFDMMGRLKKGKDEFTGLQQFAALCANPNLSLALEAVQNTISLAVSDLPIGGGGAKAAVTAAL